MHQYDAVLLVSFGGPETHEDVIPFLENVLRGKNVPRERMLEVAGHYYHFDGKSPINTQNREFIAALSAELKGQGLHMPVYWGNRNWHPLLPATLREMHSNGVRRAVAVVTSAFGSYSGCRQYREDIVRALDETGLANAIAIDKLNHFADKPGFAQVVAERVIEASAQLGDAARSARLVFTAHSIPNAMAAASPYVQQLEQNAARAAAIAGYSEWRLVYQSRSGPPTQPWLEPDVCDHLRELAAQGARQVLLCPLGFLSDHMEVLYDLDTEAAQLCEELGIQMARAATPGIHPRFIQLVREMIAAGETTPAAMRCMADCCPSPQRPVARPIPPPQQPSST